MDTLDAVFLSLGTLLVGVGLGMWVRHVRAERDAKYERAREQERRARQSATAAYNTLVTQLVRELRDPDEGLSQPRVERANDLAWAVTRVVDTALEVRERRMIFGAR